MYLRFLLYIFLIIIVITEINTAQGQVKPLAKDTINTENEDTIPKADATTEIEAPIDYSASDSIIFSIEGQIVYLYKDAVVNYGEIELKADYIEFDLANSEIYACGLPDSTGTMQGKPIFSEKGDVYNTDEIRYNFKSKKAYITGVITKQSDGFLHSKITKKQEDGSIHIAGGKYTTCDLEHPHFYIALTKAIVKPGEKIVSGPLYFVIEDVKIPFIGLPFGFFPSKKGRASGFIIPTYGEEKRRGFYLQNGGYYFTLSDYWDLAITGEVYSKGTFGINAKSRYKKRYRYNGNFDLRYQSFIESEKGLPDYSKRNSYSIRWTHAQDPKANPFSNFSANVNFETNSYSAKNARTHEEMQNSQKSSSVSFRKSFPNAPFNFTANLQASQNTQSKTVNLSLPTMNLNMNTIYPLKKKNPTGDQKWYEKLSVGYSSNFKNTVIAADSVLFEEETLDKLKTGYSHNVPISLPIDLGNISFVTIRPSLGYKGVINTRWIEKSYHHEYRTEDTIYNDYIKTDTLSGIKYAHQYDASISLNINPRWYGTYNFTPEWLKSRIPAIRHMIQPTVTFSFKPPSFIDDSDYNRTVQKDSLRNTEDYDIFSGVGAYGAPGKSRRSGSISFALNNNLEMKIRNKNDTTSEAKKVKLLESFNINTSYDIFKDTCKLSNITFRASTNILQKIKLSLNGIYDPYVHDMNDGQQTRYYVWEKPGQKLRLQSARLTTGMTFKSKTDKDGNKAGDMPSENSVFDPYSVQYVDFNIPWSLNVDYSIDYRSLFDKTRKKFKSEIKQNIRTSGNFSLTDKWKLTFSGSYDFDAKKLSSTSLGIVRDLHCWEMTFNWVPMGAIQQYNFRIAIKSNVFDGVEYKIDKRTGSNYTY